jgi:hypothetical protein
MVFPMRLRAIVGLASVAIVAAVAWDGLQTAPARSIWLDVRQTSDGRAQFMQGDFGAIDLDTLATSALPWPLLAAALALQEADGQADRVTPLHVSAAFRRVGFLDREAMPATPLPPQGMTLGVISRPLLQLRLQAVNLGCASCHAGVSYREDGTPRPDEPWPGMPNTSLDLEAYAQLVFRALQAGFAEENRLNKAIDRLFPELDWRERLTLRWVALPIARQRLALLKKQGLGPLPFSNGGPGRTNGVAALKLRLGHVPAGKKLDDAGFVSIPDLADRSLRSALLADGAYAPPGQPRFVEKHAVDARRDALSLARIGAFFTVPSMGLTPPRALSAIPAMEAIGEFLATYRPQPFPGPVDEALLPRGRDVYALRCASCHGIYNSDLTSPRLISFPNWAGDVGTDMSRSMAFTAALADSVNSSVFAPHVNAASTGKVAAPLLSGVWATAPYFVNGSVPTLRHVLEPASRPKQFEVGGHRLDWQRVGIAGQLDPQGVWRYPAGYRPFAQPQVYDTSQAGLSNRGHEVQVSGLEPADVDALIAYLKRL